MSIKRISEFKFIVKMSPVSSRSPSVRKKNNQPLPKMISSGDCMFSANNPLLGSDKNKKNHHYQLLPDQEFTHSVVKGSVFKGSSSSVLKGSSVVKGSSSAVMGSALKTSSSHSAFNLKGKAPLVMKGSSDNNAKTEEDEGCQRMMKKMRVVPLLPDVKGSSSSALKTSSSHSVVKGGSSAVKGTALKTSSSHSAFNLKGKAPLVMKGSSDNNKAKTQGFKSLKKPQGHDDDASEPTKHPKAIKASKRPRNQDNDDYETSVLNLKRRKPTLTTSGVKPKPAESLETSPAISCQTVVSSSCGLKKKAVDSVNDSSDASSVINVPAHAQKKAVFKNPATRPNAGLKC